MEKIRHFVRRRDLYAVITLSITFMLMTGQTTLATQNENLYHYKMLSSLEYSGQNQFRNDVEMQCTVKKVTSDDKVQYFLSTDSSLGGDKMSFIIDGKTQNLSSLGKELAFLEKVCNQCSTTFKKVTKSNIGKTWKQSFDISPLGDSVPSKLTFTMTAIRMNTEEFGEMIAIRALSEPFSVKTDKENEGVGSIQARINSVYVFDPEFEDIYLSISVFKATTNVNGYNETLQHSVSTYKTDPTGRQIDLGVLGKDKDFEKLVSKLGLTSNLKVVKASSLPHWARVEGIKAAQVANICAATSCEGALNPVATVCLPAARTVELQSFSEPKTTSAQLAGSGNGGDMGNMFNWFGWNWPTAAWVGGITFGTLGAAGAFDDTDTEYRSPSTP